MRTPAIILPLLLLAALSPVSLRCEDAPVETELGEHGFLDSGGVRLHYVKSGSGPLLVLLHGFPDFWYSWHRQMPALARQHEVVALDLRGFNRSGQPEGVDAYRMEKLVGDVAAVVRHFERERAIIVGHDWGGAIAWSFAMAHPGMTERLVLLNLPHPAGLLRELATNPQQQENSQYAREFQKPDAAEKLSPEALTFWIRDEALKARYIGAYRRSSMEGMLNYYKANYPRPPYAPPEGGFPPVRSPVLMIHGLDDTALLPGALNDTWKWLEKDLTLVTVPNAGHWVHHDAAELVTRTLIAWLGRDRPALGPEEEERMSGVIEKVDRLCRNETVHMIGPEKARRLAALVREEQPDLVVECGTALGYSALWIARELARLGRGRLVTIEIDAGRAARAREHVREAGLEKYVEVRVGDARELVKAIDARVDFLFLDCNFSNYAPCYRGIRPALADRALLVADNVGIGEASMRDYLDEVRAEHASSTEWFTIGLPWAERDAFEVTRFRRKEAGDARR